MGTFLEDKWKSAKKGELKQAANTLLFMKPQESKIVLSELDKRQMGSLVSEDVRQAVQKGKTKGPPDPDSLFSDGVLGLLGKGPAGWVLIGLIAGAAATMFRIVSDYLSRG